MASAITKLLTTESFRARERHSGPVDAFANGHTAPIFRRLHS
jgi:hypothetical protein